MEKTNKQEYTAFFTPEYGKEIKSVPIGFFSNAFEAHSFAKTIIPDGYSKFCSVQENKTYKICENQK